MNTSSIEHVFFDLDNTLWDFGNNSKKILYSIYQNFKLDEMGISSFELFHKQYAFRNEMLWKEYKVGTKTKEEVRIQRFRHTLYDHGIDNNLMAHELADFYIENTKKVKDLLPGAIETLDKLSEKYILHVITNGFDEVQFFKIKNSGIDHYFKTVTTAEQAGVLKPEPAIFELSLKKARASARNSVYIGDSPEADGKGALNAGMNFIWFNYKGEENTYKFDYVVHGLQELTNNL